MQGFFRTILDQLFPVSCAVCRNGDDFLCKTCLDSVVWEAQVQEIEGLSVRSALSYDQPVISSVVQAWKYEAIHGVVEPLFGRMPSMPLVGDVIVPVPLHRRRFLERGFNQAEVLAAAWSKKTGIPMDTRLCRRRYTAPQAKKDGDERRKNVKDAFVWKGESLVGKHVVLIDDVVTTGSTLLACAEALKAGGAKTVTALCLARSK